jgi:dTDP-4-dehydrorhamnose 3,5-epimerase
MTAITPLGPDGLLLIEGPIFADDRGAFIETWRRDRFAESGIAIDWQQDNMSVSKQIGTIRGLHWQLPPFAQAKLVRVVRGAILDVVVDIRQASPTFRQALGVHLSDQVNQALLVPEGFAHGFCTLAPDTVVTYKTSARYDPASERAVHWTSEGLGIDWPVDAQHALLSPKDAAAPMLQDVKKEDLF